MKQLSFLMIIIIAACNSKPNLNEKLIIGNWQAISWVNASGQSVEQVESVKFNFNVDGKYSYTNEEVNEKGAYKVENGMLFTTPEKQNEMMVKITKLTKDSLIFEMSRGGQSEVLSLVKK